MDPRAFRSFLPSNQVKQMSLSLFLLLLLSVFFFEQALIMHVEVKQLVHFIRSPTWIAPPRIQTLQMSDASDILSQIELNENNEDFTTAQKEKFVEDHAFYKKFVKAVEKQVNANFPIVSL
jgi:hypothetical protein